MMSSLAQYDSFLSIYICLLATIPCVILGLLGKRSKVVNLVVSAVMVITILGLQTFQMLQFLLFLIWELLLIPATKEIPSSSSFSFAPVSFS